MLEVSLYSFKESPFENLKECRDSLLVTPNPKLSDGARSELFRLDLGHKIHTITISKLIKDMIASSSIEGSLTKKAEVLPILVSAWEKLVGVVSFNKFLSAYNIFTELRGFTTDYELIKDTISEFDEDLQKACFAFWSLFESFNILDEHKAYSELSNLETEFSSFAGKDKVIFWGFDHLSATQIDLLNSLSEKNDILVLYPKALYANRTKSDWISWLKDDLDVSREIHSQADLTIYRFPKNRLAQMKFEEDFKNRDVVFPESDLGTNSVLDLPRLNSFYSLDARIFSAYASELKDEFKAFLQKDTGDLLDAIAGKIEEARRETQFRELKVLFLYKEAIESLLGQTNVFLKVNVFFLESVKYIVELNLPRNYLIPLVSTELNQLLGVEDYIAGNFSNYLLVASSNQGSIKSSQKLIDPLTYQKLSSLGPVFNANNRFLIFKEKLKNDLFLGKCQLVLEEGIENENESWNEIVMELGDFTSAYLNPRDYPDQRLAKEETQQSQVKTISYSKLQSYLDCPRKYYVEYIEKLSVRPEFEHKLRSDQLGSLQHKVIEEFFEKDLPMSELNSLVHSNLRKLLSVKKVKLDYLDYEKAYQEIYLFAANGIRFLENCRKNPEFRKMSFEVPFEENEARGRVDCILEYSFGNVIIDFKRSSASIAKNSEVQNFDKIQLPFYLNKLKGNVFASAYLNLSDIPDSYFYYESKDSIGSEVDLFDVKKKYEFSFEKRGSGYNEFEGQLIKRLKAETSYLPSPLNKNVCQFCAIKNLCEKGND